MNAIVRHVLIEVTCQEVGEFLANSDGDKQATALIAMVEAIRAWRPHQAWPMQCRTICDCLTSDMASEVASALKTLVEHLDERAADRLVPVGVGANQ